MSLITLVALPNEAEAGTKRALLVGVSGYKAPVSALRGPGNDVVLMRQVLPRLGYASANIKVLSDAVPDGGIPTRAAIMAELSRLTAASTEGDEVMVLIAGHGTRQPAKPEDIGLRSVDGLDAIVLPIDIGQWDGAGGTVTNAISNFEIREWLEKLRSRGVFVWLIFDACHSANMTRSALPDDVRFRGVSPETLNIPRSAMEAAQARAPRQRGGTAESSPPMGLDLTRGTKKGDFVAFFAAQSEEEAPERALPPAQSGNKTHGLLTYSIAQAITLNPGASFAQVGQQLLQLYAVAENPHPTPLLTGTGLSRAISGGQTEGKPQWLVQRKDDGKLVLAAGAFHMLTQGTVLALLPNAIAKDKSVIGYAEIATVDGTTSILRPIAYGGKAAPAVSALPEDFSARLVEPRPDLLLHVGRPVLAEGQAGAAIMRQVIAELEISPGRNTQLRWSAPGEANNIRLVVDAGRLWFVSSESELIREGPGQTISVGLDKPIDKLLPLVRDTLAQMGKAINLTRLAAQGYGSGLASANAQVTITSNGRPVRLNDGVVPRVGNGDRLDITLENTGNRPVDFTVLQITPQFGVNVVFPMDGEHNRIDAHGRKRLGARGFQIKGAPGAQAGVERLLVIAVEAEDGAALNDFSFLAQPEVPKTRSDSSFMGRLLMETGFGIPSTRGGSEGQSMDKTWLRVFSWKEQP
ncbi:hypothetical protein A6A04_19415 [Paramagnetospirillum marisnigri]|uniref:Peptidase C14 caspase domain-containing protein n=1 Tax=Paramagnetospirillum marisnigri TaxID=1285242 RepID=A0A178MLR5_9PROT|nr:hypothetical protein A6A04_19415 [Paramagnetospirillum marisnigri]